MFLNKYLQTEAKVILKPCEKTHVSRDKVVANFDLVPNAGNCATKGKRGKTLLAKSKFNFLKLFLDF